MRITAPSLLLALGLAAPAAADTFTVSPGGPLPTVQAGLDAASPGDTVLVLEGTYPGDFVNTKSLIVVRGLGSVVLVGNGAFVGAKKCAFLNFTVNGTGDALDVDGNSHGNLFSNLTLTSGGAGTVAMRVSGNRNVVTKSIAAASDVAFEIDGSFNLVSKCLAVPGTGDDGFDIGGERNLVTTCAAAGMGGDGFDVGGRANLVVKSAANGCAQAGFRVGGPGNALLGCAADQNVESGLTFEGNGSSAQKCRFGVVAGNAGPGVAFDGADGNLLARCLVTNNGGEGVVLGTFGNGRDNRIERNRVMNNAGDGILLSSSGNADDNWVEKNLVTANGGGGIVVQSDHNVILKNKVSGNVGTPLDNTGTGNLVDGNK